METVLVALNQAMYLGLDEYESHFAFYAPGASYLKPLHRFREDDRRTVSVAIYLNYHWLPKQGGALRLRPTGKSTKDISPLGSSMVLFLSADMQRDVLSATRNWQSLAGWFRRQA